MMAHDFQPAAALCAPSALLVVASTLATTQPRVAQAAADALAVQVFSAFGVDVVRSRAYDVSADVV